VCVGIPTIDGKLHANLVDALLADTLLGHAQGVHFLVKSEMGCSLIGAARNKLARWFLDTPQADALIFVDSDISWKCGALTALAKRDRKSTRLNSSHVKISYAVFCLKKK